jgi:putative DNA primase/helicase
MRENFSEFKRINKTILVTNHKPRVETGGHGLWRRVALVPFVSRFWNEDRGESGPVELKADVTLPQRLLAERSGILAWLVRGAVECYRAGLKLGACKAIADATAEYQAGEDTFAQFVAETLTIIPGSNAELQSADVWNAHQAWCSENNQKPQTKRRMTELLLGLGVGKRVSNGKTIYTGVALRKASTG